MADPLPTQSTPAPRPEPWWVRPGLAVLIIASFDATVWMAAHSADNTLQVTMFTTMAGIATAAMAYFFTRISVAGANPSSNSTGNGPQGPGGNGQSPDPGPTSPTGPLPILPAAPFDPRASSTVGPSGPWPTRFDVPAPPGPTSANGPTP